MASWRFQNILTRYTLAKSFKNGKGVIQFTLKLPFDFWYSSQKKSWVGNVASFSKRNQLTKQTLFDTSHYFIVTCCCSPLLESAMVQDPMHTWKKAQSFSIQPDKQNTHKKKKKEKKKREHIADGEKMRAGERDSEVRGGEVRGGEVRGGGERIRWILKGETVAGRCRPPWSKRKMREEWRLSKREPLASNSPCSGNKPRFVSSAALSGRISFINYSVIGKRESHTHTSESWGCQIVAFITDSKCFMYWELFPQNYSHRQRLVC